MAFNIPLIEWVGYIASVVVAVSLTMSSIIKLRWINLAGSAVFSFYGFAIGSIPVGLLNLFIAFVNIYYLLSVYSRKETFKLISIASDDSYLSYFLDYYKHEIEKFFPGFERQKQMILGKKINLLSLLILRNAVAAGIFIGERENGQLKVHLDFVIPEYRDMQPGKFLFIKNADFFLNQGIKQIKGEARSKKHFNYLKMMGFVEQENNSGSKILVKTL